MLAENSLQEGEVVEIQRRYPVDREALFQAWTNPDALRAWFGPEGVETQLAEIDLQVGGRYRIEMVMSSGGVVEHHGIYEEIVSPEKLVFTWSLPQDGECDDGMGAQVETRVTVRFNVVDEQTTDLYLLHEGLPTRKSRDGHELGWTGCFVCLSGHVVPTATES